MKLKLTLIATTLFIAFIILAYYIAKPYWLRYQLETGVETALEVGVSDNVIDKIDSALSKGVDPDYIFRDMPIIYIATYVNSKELVDVIINHNANVNVTYKGNFRTPLHVASMNGEYDIVGSLLNAGSQINTLDREGKTPLYLSVSHSHPKVANLLIRKGAKLNTATNNHDSLLWVASAIGAKECVSILLEYNANINYLAKSSNDSPLGIACKNGHIETVNILLPYYLNTLDRHGSQALFNSAYSGHSNIVATLIDLGVSPDSTYNGIHTCPK